MAEDMIKFCKFAANILVIFVICGILVISISITYGSESPVSHDGAIPIRIQSTSQINGTINEDYKWADIFFRGDSAGDNLLDQQVTVNLQNTGTRSIITAPLIATVEESAAITLKPGEKREVFRGRLGDLIDTKFDCADKSRKKGIGVSAFETPLVRARIELVFQNPQNPGELKKISMRSWWFSPGEV